MPKIILASENNIKESSVIKWLKKLNKKNIEIKKIKVANKFLPHQPINTGGTLCCSDRIKYVKDNFDKINEYDYIISIENSIRTENTNLIDCVDVKILNIKYDQEYISKGGDLSITTKLISEFKKLPNIIEDFLENYKLTNKEYIYDGCTLTFGELVNRYYPNIDSKNYMKKMLNKDRKVQILSVLEKLSSKIL